MGADEAKALLEFRGNGIFEPDEMIGFERFPEARRLDGSEAMMRVVQEKDVLAEFLAEPRE